MPGKKVKNKCPRKVLVGLDDLKFPSVDLKMNLPASWSQQMTDRVLINATNSYESSIIFAAKVGWIPSKAPYCQQLICKEKDTSSYLRQKLKRKRKQENQKG